MPWKCPACQTQIAHDGDSPDPKRVYGCHVCHLELVLDDRTRKLTVMPFHTDRPNRHTTDPQS
jgi:hypothetical protein